MSRSRAVQPGYSAWRGGAILEMDESFDEVGFKVFVTEVSNIAQECLQFALIFALFVLAAIIGHVTEKWLIAIMIFKQANHIVTRGDYIGFE